MKEKNYGLSKAKANAFFFFLILIHMKCIWSVPLLKSIHGAEGEEGEW